MTFETIAPEAGGILDRQHRRRAARARSAACGATRLQMLRLGKGVAQHVLIAGKTGSGKSTLLHALVTNLAMWYSPDEVEFYLIDFKKGVEFKTYATTTCPHARAIAVESDREFGLSVLQRLDAELTRRGDLYRKAGVQDLAAYRKRPTPRCHAANAADHRRIPGILLRRRQAGPGRRLLLDRLVRQGRAFGMHVLLGSQTIGGSSGLHAARSGRWPSASPCMTSEADSQLILGDNNSAARLLTVPARRSTTTPAAWSKTTARSRSPISPMNKKDRYLDQGASNWKSSAGDGHGEPLVFEGNAAGRSHQKPAIGIARSPPKPGRTRRRRCWRGWAIRSRSRMPTAIVFRRQSGSNVLIVGQADEAALALLALIRHQPAAQHAASRTSASTFSTAPPPIHRWCRSSPASKQALPHDSEDGRIPPRRRGHQRDRPSRVQTPPGRRRTNAPSIYRHRLRPAALPRSAQERRRSASASHRRRGKAGRARQSLRRSDPRRPDLRHPPADLGRHARLHRPHASTAAACASSTTAFCSR